MTHKFIRGIAFFVAVGWVSLALAGVGRIPLPKLPSEDKYGNVIMDRVSSRTGIAPVVFSHWSHRVHFTCRVCHTDLGFTMKKGGSEVSMADIRNGLFCGACHNDDIAFSAGAEEVDCGRCHGIGALPEPVKFRQLRARAPAANFGNKIDWTKAIETGLIKPKNSVEGQYSPFEFEKSLVMEPGNKTVPAVTFPHKKHTAWLGCESCHPDVFNIELKGTLRFSKQEMLNARYCGLCHLNIAFPLDDCVRCHINVWPE